MKYGVGDLLIRGRDKRPCLIAAIKESGLKQWGQLDANRKLYKLFDGDCYTVWLTDTQIIAGYNPTTS